MSAAWIEKYVDTGDFTGLFVEGLGWQKPRKEHSDIKVEADGETLVASEAGHYKGIAVWVCPTIPAASAQRVVDAELRRLSAERIVIFHDGDQQVWRWPQSRDASGAGSPRLVTHDHVVGRGNEALRQRLQLIKVGMDEEPTSVEVARRLRKAFDSDKVTKKFYKKFAQQHADLISLVEGIEVSDPVSKPELRWYGSLLLNRLMFIYFMQRKGFLDNDPDYLRRRLDRLRTMGRSDSFYGFYRDFLLPLFHEGLGASEGNRQIDDPEILELLGDVPYVNGGIFSRHVIEETNEIRVPDAAFERLFDFFDSWQWHLDDRPSGKPNEINPDVLGYIFEQFVNHREEVAKGNTSAATNADKGAYYTKEDVTGYMVANTLVPVFLERLEAATGVNPWNVLRKDPDRYIWSSLQHGLAEELPGEIVAEANQMERPSWDATAPPEHIALTAETWWEVVDRREHVVGLRERMRKGKVKSYAEAISENLDLETLALDVVDAIDNPADVAAAWSILTGLRVLDPTCGSGAFLFAALNVLHLLYGAVLDAAETHLTTSRNKELRSIIESAERHANRNYFLLKHATINNLYGVDIMAEAVEIARLRLFLKLVSQVEHRREVEPLPDLEFNIVAGNVLVGALTVDDVRAKSDLLVAGEGDALSEIAAQVGEDYRAFARAQVEGLDEEFRAAKSRLVSSVADVRERLNLWWQRADSPNSSLSDYVNRTVPFHWFIEFPNVFEAGGFDVVVGNPPYVNPSKKEKGVRVLPYTYEGFATDKCPDIYAPCLERAASVCRDGGRLSMIVPLSLSFADTFEPCREMFTSRFPAHWVSTYGNRPSSIFAGVQIRCTIAIGSSDADGHHQSNHNVWEAARRPTLFERLRYAALPTDLAAEHWYKVGDPALVDLIETMAKAKSVGHVAVGYGGEELHWKPVARYWFPVSPEPFPAYELNGLPWTDPTAVPVRVASAEDRDALFAAMAGKLGYLWWSAVADDYHVPAWVVRSFPAFHIEHPELVERLMPLARKLKKRLPKATIWNLNAGKWSGNYDLRECMDLTDEIDQIILDVIGQGESWPALQEWHRKVMRATGEATGSVRGPKPPIEVKG
jgi:hypothetical protein